MKTTIVVLLIMGTLVSVLVVIPQFQGYGIRTLPGRTEYLSEPEQKAPEKDAVAYIARPSAELGRQLLSPSVSDQSKENAWASARGKWVLWKGAIRSIEPAINPNRIVLVDEYQAPMPLYTQRFAVVVEFDSQQSKRLKKLEVGQTVYFRARLVEKEFRLADVYRYGLDFSSHVLSLDEGQIVDDDHVAAILADLAYISYEQIDRLSVAAKRTHDVMDYFERRANVSSDVRWQLMAAATRIAGIRLPHDPPMSENGYTESGGISITVVKREAALAKSKIEQSLASTLTLLHTLDEPPGFDHHIIHEAKQSNARMVTANEDFVEEIEVLRDEDKRRGEIGIGDLTWFGIGQILGWPASLVISVVNSAARFGEDLGYLPLYDGMIVICERQLHIIGLTVDRVLNSAVDAIEDAIMVY